MDPKDRAIANADDVEDFYLDHPFDYVKIDLTKEEIEELQTK